ncbi:MAG: ribonuclease Y [Candidatus Colwellbacteria bacterium RIFCSPHIGHO2_12_FULL_44_17]|uniref:Ribonuclease Y n=2 Tax=Candidatus Colwelliibacteriota TaxID=1817904 RepID=A0A1G1Z6J3_9BACT|nr:MAG: ribonuclease Y [Candidatus Colwellbacteria bacterium RIFCSPHIGHO2_12_FULL_44_17]OGY59287.1 MAG: ribonuclease Y [Candidatus Colwellbacteria bacterium RIFCSPLOWO2_02_FULL_44_20b]
MTEISPIVAGGVLLILGTAVGYVIREVLAVKRANSVDRKIQTELLSAKSEAKQVVLDAQNKAAALLDETMKEERERKTSLARLEERTIKKEESLDEREDELRNKTKTVESEIEKLKVAKAQIDEIKTKTETELAEVAGLSTEEAKDRLLKETEKRHKDDLVLLMQKLDKERREEIEKKSVDIMTTAIQRYARSSVSEITTSAFDLPEEDIKGKIIGREGRNIRTLERLTGAEFIIDEVPGTIIISSFDPLRREVARLTLEKLIKDGRIQPAKIEEKVDEAKAELDKRMEEIGEAAIYEVGVLDLPKEIVKLLGRLHFRTSFGQNVLNHSIEMAHIAGMIATELGLNVEITKKGALVHDIGKAIDHEVQGTHVELGIKILKKYGVSEDVIKAMQSHHDDYPFASPEAYVVTAADILSAARPGARRGTLENYIKRLGDLEKIANSFVGVKNSYAVSAGRELRIFVVPEKIDDFGALQLARDVAAKIQSELKYPGEIKVNVIREVRAVEYAK